LAELIGNPVQLNLRVADALLHIGREAISNALSHGNPTVLKIKLTYEDGTVELVIVDNGCGFEHTQEKEGFGILGMQKRARGLGSELSICSEPGKGTLVGVKAALKSIRLRDRIATAFKRRIRWSLLEG
jgi:signal transduction histidine kinase